MDLLRHDTGSAKRLNKKGCTSSRVSGPPRFSNNTPTLSSPIKGAAEVFWVFEATNALGGGKNLLIDFLENMDCESGNSKEYLETTWHFVGQASIWSLKARCLLEPTTLEVGLCREKNTNFHCYSKSSHVKPFSEKFFNPDNTQVYKDDYKVLITENLA